MHDMPWIIDESRSIAELRAEAELRLLPTHGTKRELRVRIMEHYNAQHQQEIPEDTENNEQRPPLRRRETVNDDNRGDNRPPLRRRTTRNYGDQRPPLQWRAAGTMSSAAVLLIVDRFNPNDDMEALRDVADAYGIDTDNKHFYDLRDDVRRRLENERMSPAPQAAHDIVTEWVENYDPPPTDNERFNMRNVAGYALAGIVGAIALFLGLLTFFVIDRLADDDDNDTGANSGAKYAADTFGGNASDWKIAPNSGGSGWVYEGPPTEIKVPEDHRIDYPGASCAEAGTSGVYGPLTLERSGPLTVWSIPGETKCPETAVTNTNNTNDTSTTNNSNNQSTNEPVVNTRAGCNAAIVNNEGYPGPTTAQAKVDTGIDVQRLGTECSAFVFRHPQTVASATVCTSGYVCTFTLTDGSVKVFIGDNESRMASAATYRWVDGYPENDKVHEDPPCKLARSEDRFGAGEDPAFVATAGNFSCSSSQPSSPSSPQPAAVNTTQCGDPAEQLGGTWVRDGNKMSLQGTAEITGHPAWTIHTPGYPGDPGLPPGSFETTDTASAYCDPFKG